MVPKPNSTLTGLLRKMEHTGLITRERDDADGRSVRIRLTTAAKRLRKRMYEMHKELLNILHDGLSRRQIDETREALDRMIDSIRQTIP